MNVSNDQQKWRPHSRHFFIAMINILFYRHCLGIPHRLVEVVLFQITDELRLDGIGVGVVIDQVVMTHKTQHEEQNMNHSSIEISVQKYNFLKNRAIPFFSS